MGERPNQAYTNCNSSYLSYVWKPIQADIAYNSSYPAYNNSNISQLAYGWITQSSLYKFQEFIFTFWVKTYSNPFKLT